MSGDMTAGIERVCRLCRRHVTAVTMADGHQEFLHLDDGTDLCTGVEPCVGCGKPIVPYAMDTWVDARSLYTLRYHYECRPKGEQPMSKDPIQGPLMKTQTIRETEQFYIGEHTIELGEFPGGTLRIVVYRHDEFLTQVPFHPRAARQLANAILLRVGQGMET